VKHVQEGTVDDYHRICTVNSLST